MALKQNSRISSVKIVQLRAFAARMRREVADLEEVRQQAKEQQERLEKLEVLPVKADQVPQFRQEIVDWARQSGCQVRRIRLESPRERGWTKGGDLNWLVEV